MQLLKLKSTSMEFPVQALLENSEKRYATIKQIEIVGEACNNMRPELRDAHPGIPWNQIRGFRNLSIHEYFGVDFHLVWEIATIDLPVLNVQFIAVLKDLD